MDQVTQWKPLANPAGGFHGITKPKRIDMHNPNEDAKLLLAMIEDELDQRVGVHTAALRSALADMGKLRGKLMLANHASGYRMWG